VIIEWVRTNPHSSQVARGFGEGEEAAGCLLSPSSNMNPLRAAAGCRLRIQRRDEAFQKETAVLSIVHPRRRVATWRYVSSCSRVVALLQEPTGGVPSQFLTLPGA
jgi:hypothetical protein